MDSLQNILGGLPQKKKPDEHNCIKSYVKKELGYDVQLVSSRDAVTILVEHGAAATMVRMQLHDIQEHCKVAKRLWVRIDGSANSK